MKLTDERIADLVDRIVNAVHPLRIIVFGSTARGDAREDSDIDVMVVVPDGTNRHDTAADVYRSFRELRLDVDIDVVAATESDLTKHANTHGLVYKEAIKEGVEIYVSDEGMQSLALLRGAKDAPTSVGSEDRWLISAKSDMAFAGMPQPPEGVNDHICYHAEQAAEKSLKAALLHFGVEFPFTHNLQELIEVLPANAGLPTNLGIALPELTRYITAKGFPEQVHAKKADCTRAVEIARATFEWAQGIICPK